MGWLGLVGAFFLLISGVLFILLLGIVLGVALKENLSDHVDW